jgi:hypothetical protein
MRYIFSRNFGACSTPSDPGVVQIVLVADALLIGSCGRTDLLIGNATRRYHTLYYVFRRLPDDLLAYPAP